MSYKKNVYSEGKYRAALDEIQGLSPKKFKNTLIRLGISKADGALTDKYATKK